MSPASSSRNTEPTGSPSIRVVPLPEYPAALPLCARWNFEQWGREDGETLEGIADALDGMSRPGSSEHALVALLDGTLAGMVLLIGCDLESHRHLTPWVAGVYVDPAFRKQGVARALVGAAENCARRDGHAEAWLYTGFPDLYASMGWSTRETLGGECAGMSLMTKPL